MLSSRATGWMLSTGIVGFIIFTVSVFIQGDQDGTSGVVAWAAASKDWEPVLFLRMIALIFMIVFTTGFISWTRSINESGSAITLGKNFALLALILMWTGFISQLAGFESASDNSDAAYALIKLSNFGNWFGGLLFGVSFFLAGASAYMAKSGTPVLNGLLAILGIVGAIGSFFTWFIWIGGFGLGLLVLGIIGLKKLVTE